MGQEQARRVVIVGAGHAGYAAARALRARSSDASVTVVTADDGYLYSKPSLSVSLSSRLGAGDLVLSSASQMRAQLGCEIETHTRVTAIDRNARMVLAGDRALPYESLILALGAVPVLPDIPGLAECPRLVCLHDLQSYRRLVELLPTHGRVTILGAGFIGCELANDLRRAGHAVTLIDRAPRPLSGLAPAAVGVRLRQALERAGVTCILEARPVCVGSSLQGGAVTVELEAHEAVTSHVLLCATGQRPNDELARAAGLSTERGVCVDSQLRTTDPCVFALGDCARLLPYNLQFIAPIAPAAAAISGTLFGDGAALRLPALGVSVKTPCFPVVGSAGARHEAMTWEVREDAGGISAFSFGAGGALQAFALGGSHVSRRGEFLSQLPPLF